MRNRRHLLTDYDGTREVWPAFTDVMSTMAMILFVLVLLAYVRNLISAKRLDAFQRQIVTSELKLRSLEDELRRTSAEVLASESRLHEQQAVITDSSRQLESLRSQLQSIAVLRVGVLNKLKQSVEAELGAKSTAGGELVTVGDNGNIVINESLVFEFGSYAIKNDARPLLDSLARALGHLLAADDIRNNIDTILIQGHTDERGSASYNWDLSAKRATTVLEYLFQSNRTLAQFYGSYFAAGAYSKFRPLNLAKTEESYRQNRRIEIAVVPRDAHVRQIIDEYVKSIPAMLQPSPAP
jgi:chemotaxis protein MotB